MALAALVRVATHLQVRDGSIPYLHWWTQSDMSFNDAWARDIAAGNVLGVPAPRPYHRWHGEVAAEAHRRLGAREPFDEGWARALWGRWLGARSFYQDPLFPYALAGVYAAGGGPGTALALQGALGVLVVGLIALIACELWGARVGLGAGVIAALYAPLIFYEAMLVRSALQALVLAASLAAAVHAPRTARSGPWWAACGVFAGLGIVAHATGALFAAALGIWLAATRAPERRLRDVAAYGGGIVLALSPLLARNLAVGLPLLDTSSARAVNVITALAVDAQPRAGLHISAHTARILAETDGRFLPTVRATLSTHPDAASVLAQAGRKLLAFWEAREATDNVSFDYFLLHASLLSTVGLRFALVAPLAVFGILLCVRKPGPAAPLLIAVLGVLGVALLFFPSSRVRLPVAVALIPFAAFGVSGAATLSRERRYGRFAALAAGSVVAAVLVAAPWESSEGDLRETDYAVGNEIAALRVRVAADDADAQVRVVESQLRTEPAALRALEPQPGTRAVIPVAAARLAGSFAALHAAGARAYAARGDSERAAFHVRRAEVLSVVARQESRERDQGP